jgi:hypothetical protein
MCKLVQFEITDHQTAHQARQDTSLRNAGFLAIEAIAALNHVVEYVLVQ